MNAPSLALPLVMQAVPCRSNPFFSDIQQVSRNRRKQSFLPFQTGVKFNPEKRAIWNVPKEAERGGTVTAKIILNLLIYNDNLPFRYQWNAMNDDSEMVVRSTVPPLKGGTWNAPPYLRALKREEKTMNGHTNESTRVQEILPDWRVLANGDAARAYRGNTIVISRRSRR